MTRSIDIGYQSPSGSQVDIEIHPPYFLLGAQSSSLEFWSIPRLKEIGIERLTILGDGDPLLFCGWDDMATLGNEIDLLAKHLESVNFHPKLKAEWLSHLTYCYHLLIASTPQNCKPQLGIG
jgi:hypothetical protein